MMKRLQFLGSVLMVVLLLTSACGGPAEGEAEEATPPDSATTQVEAHYRDSSVPPQYHRSWTLTLNHAEAHIIIDSYGDVIADETVAMPAAMWDAFVADLERSLDALDEPSGEGACPGGTGVGLEVSDGGAADSRVEVDGCADSDRALRDEIKELVRPFTDLVDLETLTKRS